MHLLLRAEELLRVLDRLVLRAEASGLRVDSEAADGHVEMYLSGLGYF